MGDAARDGDHHRQRVHHVRTDRSSALPVAQGLGLVTGTALSVVEYRMLAFRSQPTIRQIALTLSRSSLSSSQNDFALRNTGSDLDPTSSTAYKSNRDRLPVREPGLSSPSGSRAPPSQPNGLPPFRALPIETNESAPIPPSNGFNALLVAFANSRTLDGADSAADAAPPGEIPGLLLFERTVTAREDVELIVCKLSQSFFKFFAAQFPQLLRRAGKFTRCC